MAFCLFAAVFILALQGPFCIASNYSPPSNKPAVLLPALFPKASNSTPRFHNLTGLTANPQILALKPFRNHTLGKRQNTNGLPTGTCAPGTPCSNGACCSNTGICGYSPNECGSKTCISNCDAKAECGKYAMSGKANCPLNVCCSNFGFCGTTGEFCTTSGPHPCQSGYGQCGSVDEPSCAGSSVTARTIGYYEGWSSRRDCDGRMPEDLDLTAMSHVNFAFVYFDPGTFQILPMASSDLILYSRFTGLKDRKPSLQTWLSIGGWAFNDPSNLPDTRTAFSDMASSSSNRLTFIESLAKFMRTYHFDGVDIDWEYPGAPDRGGRTEDTQNFVTLLKEMRDFWGSTYGISATIPSSYWYMRWFDLTGMSKYLDWFNIMTYDIHGVWDSTSKFEGPIIRPHTNWTEINQGLDLLWRNEIDAGQVNLGLGWYGRSFTLADAACTKPGCKFTSGGNPGECTNAGGTLSNAEIMRIISQSNVKPTMDHDAAVKWISFSKDQWVSYDDGETMQLKLQRASNLCLGGTLIWSIDQDDSSGTSSENLLGIGASNGVSEAIRDEIKRGLLTSQDAADIANSCYWSFCDGGCNPEYFPATTGRGIVGTISADREGQNGTSKTLCCAPGTTMGQCAWNGWRGVGMACENSCDNETAIAVAGNTNSNDPNDLSCNGGIQLYCCNGFKPSGKANTRDLSLLGQGAFAKRDILPRGKPGGFDYSAFCITAFAAAGVLASGGAITGGVSVFGAAILGLSAAIACLVAVDASSAAGPIGIVAGGIDGVLRPRPPKKPLPNFRPAFKPPKNPADQVGDWDRVKYGPQDEDCQVTYTCRYGKGFNEVCDNQRWGITSKLGEQNVYHYVPRGVSSDRFGISLPNAVAKDQYGNERVPFYRALAGARPDGEEGRSRCEADEFPMHALEESRRPRPQVVRYINGNSNGRQGIDFKNWLAAVWTPCAALRAAKGAPPPPITWEFGGLDGFDIRVTGRVDGNHFIQRFGFDAQTPGSSCWATFEDPFTPSNPRVTILDHGFRALPDDPMFVFKGWPLQDYKKSTTMPVGRGGGLLAPQLNVPQDIASEQWLKRREVQSILEGKIDYQEIDLEGKDVETYWAELAERTNPYKKSPRPTTATATRLDITRGQTPTDTPSRSTLSDARPRETGSHLEHHVHHFRHNRHHR